LQEAYSDHHYILAVRVRALEDPLDMGKIVVIPYGAEDIAGVYF
jgi:hypothetical protein